MPTKERIVIWLEEVCRHFNMEVPNLEFTDKTRGQALRVRDVNGVRTTITLPNYLFNHTNAFSQYYVVHECVHLAINNGKHDTTFKLKETETLADLYHIGIKYTRSYPKYLYDKNNPKNILWGTSDTSLGKGLCLIMKKH